eukprot:5516856-Prymnesium_polylepis.1
MRAAPALCRCVAWTASSAGPSRAKRPGAPALGLWGPSCRSPRTRGYLAKSIRHHVARPTAATLTRNSTTAPYRAGQRSTTDSEPSAPHPL